jgi:DNA-binding response OmpR family regulator
VVVSTILIADDDPLLTSVAQHHLEATGFRTLAVATGVAALECVRRARPNLVILDAMMPTLGGLEVLRVMRNEGRFDLTKAIMLTALNQEQIAVEAFKLGASDFIAKPFSPDELLLRIGRLLGARAA